MLWNYFLSNFFYSDFLQHLLVSRTVFNQSYQAEEKEGYFLVSLLTLIGLGALGFSLIQSFEIKNNFLIYGGIQGSSTFHH